MFGLGALGQLALGQAGLFPVIVDASAPTEYAGSFSSDTTVRDEIIFSVLRDAQSLLEILGTSDRSDSSTRLEVFQTVRAHAALPVEYQDGVAADWRPSVEFIEAISSDADAGARLEIFESVRFDASSPAEITPSVATDKALPLELMSGIPTVTTDGGVPIEITYGVSGNNQSPLEFYIVLKSIDASASTEIILNIKAESVAPLESKSPLFVSDTTVRPESIAAFVADRQAVDEINFTLSPIDSALPMEMTEPTVSANWAAPVELLGNAAVIGDASAQLETVGSILQDWTTWVDTLGKVSMMTGDSAVRLEILRSVRYSDSALVLEILQWARLRPNRNELWSEEWSGLDTIGGF